MHNAKLLSVSIERFKSFEQPTPIDLAPLTIILGRNNSGKSTLIQSLLLLKQTLSDPRSDVELKLEGMVEAFNLRELTFGRPEADDNVPGPVITLHWECDVDVEEALSEAGNPDLENLAKHSHVRWLKSPKLFPERLRTTLRLTFAEIAGAAEITRIDLISPHEQNLVTLSIRNGSANWRCQWNDEDATDIDVELDHFIPYLSVNRKELGKRDRQRAWHNAYLIIFARPLGALKKLLSEMHYLGSSRQPAPSLFKAATAPPSDLGVSGELAPQLLHRRQRDLVHYLPPLEVSGQGIELPGQVRARPLVRAVNEVMTALSVMAPLAVEEIHEVGFRLLFGGASLPHVGHGIGYLLPLIELGLIADPLRYTGVAEELSLDEYARRCGSFTHIALEEPEAHLHPKVASRFAHWLVSLARSNRRLIVETHSDHLVRRLRGLVARAGRDSELERWLLDNVVILSVEQDETGRSTVKSSHLTPVGDFAENWPADFMDESSDEESAIYDAKLDKTDLPTAAMGTVEFDDSPEPEADTAP